MTVMHSSGGFEHATSEISPWKIRRRVRGLIIHIQMPIKAKKWSRSLFTSTADSRQHCSSV